LLVYPLPTKNTAIATSITDPERIQALEKAVESFGQHDVQSIHNDEMTCGADAVLTKALSYHLMMMTKTNTTTMKQHGGGNSNCSSDSSSSSSSSSDSIEAPQQQSPPQQQQQQQQQHELALLCQALESVYRAETHLVAISFARMGMVLVRFLQQIIAQELTKRCTEAATTSAIAAAAADLVMDDDDDEDNDQEYPLPPLDPYGDAILRHATKLLGHFARVGDATEPLATFPGLLPTLIRLISSSSSTSSTTSSSNSPTTNSSSTGPCFDIPWEARLSAVWILANLACNAKNMERMVDTDQLVLCLMEVAARPRNGADSVETAMEKLRSKSTAARAILNLSWAAANKEKLADQPFHPQLLDLLCNLSLYRTDPLYRSRTVVEILVNIRRYAVGALRNLAAAPRKHKVILCHYSNGHVLDVLTDAALNDTDQAVKDRAFAAIHNLAVHDTAPLIIGRPALVMAIKDVLLTTPTTTMSTNNEEQQQQQQQQQQVEFHADGTPREHASATLMVLERSITPSMDSYQNLRDLLDELHGSSNNNNSNSNSNIDQQQQQPQPQPQQQPQQQQQRHQPSGMAMIQTKDTYIPTPVV
jgi:hypothetical protein